jgi:long-chain acyl-CoA synthetase
VPRDGVPLDADDLVGWCRDTMAAYKYPRTVVLRDSLPMTATGKILKRELR